MCTPSATLNHLSLLTSPSSPSLEIVRKVPCGLYTMSASKPTAEAYSLGMRMMQVLIDPNGNCSIKAKVQIHVHLFTEVLLNTGKFCYLNIVILYSNIYHV